jgi:hypothetical protein
MLSPTPDIAKSLLRRPTGHEAFSLSLVAQFQTVLHREVNESKTHVAHLKIPCPNGCGAGETLRELGVTSVPTRLLIGRDGRICWYGTDVTQLRGALERALRAPQEAAGNLPVRSLAGR